MILIAGGGGGGGWGVQRKRRVVLNWWDLRDDIETYLMTFERVWSGQISMDLKTGTISQQKGPTGLHLITSRGGNRMWKGEGKGIFLL